MVLEWLGRGVDVADLIARGKYDKAIGALQDQLQREGSSARLRNQLADVLIMAGRPHDAVPLLTALADEFAAEGLAAKAIALLKKIEKIQPGPAVAKRMAALIKDKDKGKPRTQSNTRFEMGGYEPLGNAFDEGHFAALANPVVTEEQRIAAARNASWQPSTHMDEPAVVPLPPLAFPNPPAATGFEHELSGLIAPPPAPASAPRAEVVASPLFSGFSEDELVAVIQGLRLVTFEPGDIILTEGDPGDSLFVLTTGVAKAFVRADGRQKLVRQMTDGTFFGEISVLSGKPRTATVTAATACELLELDRATLDAITRDYPQVRQVLEDFYIQRATNQA
jgi:hypothetical protein